MTSSLGKLAEFWPDIGNIDVYLESFELFSSANGIDASKKLPVFLTVLGEKAYETLHSLLLPKTPTEVKYEDAAKVLEQHYAPKRSVVTERYHFYRRHQEPRESIAQFIVALKTLASTCSFGNFLENALRDRLIAGLRTDAIRCRLLALPDNQVTWERVCNIATAMEAAQKETKDMLGDTAATSSEDVHWQRGIGKPCKPDATKQLATSSERSAARKYLCSNGRSRKSSRAKGQPYHQNHGFIEGAGHTGYAGRYRTSRVQRRRIGCHERHGRHYWNEDCCHRI
ncbi:uncharacterized protein LOC115330335 [Ixodes scapularis]|uniref:uncharacterized protein LOC115330335 n=1 Tax=Ixodes scapularis TaxID=6945 RepID=UPI001A9F7030|nr:uncharacterized protein LOC115330335 [Ixodes scapularis]